MEIRKRALENMVKTATNPNPEVWKDRDVFVTGHTGFKGSWLCLWLAALGARVHGYALPPNADDNTPLFTMANVERSLASSMKADIRNLDQLVKSWRDSQASVLFHLAAQPLVRESYSSPLETFAVNTLGTASVLEAVRIGDRPAAVVVISSDKCYENAEQVWGYRENDPMGGHDPYSASKGAAELVTASYRKSFFSSVGPSGQSVRLASARAGNVIGGGDWARHRLIPDMAKALARGDSAEIRNPNSIRPWQHVLEPLSGYLMLAEKMVRDPANSTWCSGWNFGPGSAAEWRVSDVAGAFCKSWGGNAKWECGELPGDPPQHEAEVLRLCIDKAVNRLTWKPRWDTATAIIRTAAWYRKSIEPDFDAAASCLTDIAAYTEADNGQ